jgi:WD40 repeat protein
MKQSSLREKDSQPSKRKAPDPFFVLRGHRKDVHALSFFTSPNASEKEYLVSGGTDGEISLWSLNRRRCIHSWVHSSSSTLADTPSVLSLHPISGNKVIR